MTERPPRSRAARRGTNSQTLWAPVVQGASRSPPPSPRMVRPDDPLRHALKVPLTTTAEAKSPSVSAVLLRPAPPGAGFFMAQLGHEVFAVFELREARALDVEDESTAAGVAVGPQRYPILTTSGELARGCRGVRTTTRPRTAATGSGSQIEMCGGRAPRRARVGAVPEKEAPRSLAGPEARDHAG